MAEVADEETEVAEDEEVFLNIRDNDMEVDEVEERASESEIEVTMSQSTQNVPTADSSINVVRKSLNKKLKKSRSSRKLRSRAKRVRDN